MTTPYPDLCRCDRVRDARGLCPHCDGRAQCPRTCPDCAMRDQQCAVCHTACGTVRAAQAHEAKCRRAERATEKRS